MGRDAGEHQGVSVLRSALCSVTHFVSQQPKLTLWVVALLSIASIGLTVRHITFKTDRADLIDADADFHQRWINYTESFPDASDIVVVVESDETETIELVLDDLGRRMQDEAAIFDNVLYKVDLRRFHGKGLQYLSPKQLEDGLKQLAAMRGVLRGRWDAVTIESLFARLRYQLKLASRTGSSETLTPILHQADALTASMTAYLDDPNEFQSPWPDTLSPSELGRRTTDSVAYLMNERRNIGFLKVRGADGGGSFNGESKSIGRLRELIAEVAPSYPTAKIGITGIPVLENDEMHRSRSDMLLASLISVVGVGLLLFCGFRGFRHPALALLMLAVGMAWAFGYTTLTIGHLNILSISFAVILIGLGIDFAIHYLARYLELRHEGEQLHSALTSTSSSVGIGIVTAAVTTALAFFCATFTQFLGVAELGIIAGGGILLCAVATFVVLPALVSLADRNVEPRRLPTPFEGNALRRLISQYPRTVLIASLVVVLGVGSQTIGFDDGRIKSKIKYDYNLLNLQADGLESVEIQKRVFQESDHSLLFAVSIADGPRQARALKRKYEALPSVDHVEDLGSLLPAYRLEKTRLLIQSYRAQLSRLPRRVGRLPAADPAEVGRAMENFLQTVRYVPGRLGERITRRMDVFLDRFEHISLRQQTLYCDEFQQRTAHALLGQLKTLAGQTSLAPVRMGDLPEELTSRFVSAEGQWLVQVYPKDQIWDIDPLERFVTEVRSVDPEATGTPLQNFEASRQIMSSYSDAALYALAVICVVLLIDFLPRRHLLLTLTPPLAVVVFTIMAFQSKRADINYVLLVSAYAGMAVAIAAVLDFRNLRDAVLTMVPPLAGGLLMFGILALLGVDLNPANLIVLPLVLGIGVDDGVHVIHDFRMQKRKYRMSSSTINAIVLTSLTSMIGFGSMMVAAHQGLYSVGLVLVVGVGSCLFVSLVTLPAVLTHLSEQDKHHPAAGQDAQPVSSGRRERERVAKVA